MNPEKHTAEYMKKLESLKLSDSSRTRIANELKSYAQFHAVSESVRVEDSSRSNEQVSSNTNRHASLFSNKYTFMPFAILLAVLVGGGTSFAAQGAIPGDFLYPVKTEINEPVRSAFAVSANAEANLQADIVAQRIAEAEELQSKGRFEGEAAAQLAARIQSSITKADEAMIDSDVEVRIVTVADLTASLSRFNALVGNDTELAISIPAAYSEMSGDTSMSSMLTTREMDIATFRANTEARVQNLNALVERNKSNVSAEVYVSLTAKLEVASELIVDSLNQAEAEARASVTEASELAGEIESQLTTLGTAEIDMQSGAIIEIDFTNVPPTELNIGADGRVEGEGSESDADSNNDSDSDSEIDIEANSNLNLEAAEVDINGAIRSGLGN